MPVPLLLLYLISYQFFSNIGDNDDSDDYLIGMTSHNSCTVMAPLKPVLLCFSRSTFQVGPEDGPQKAAPVQRLSDHGEG